MNTFLDRSRDRRIFRLALPALGTLAIEPLVGIVDTAFVGRVGTNSVAALAVATAVLSVAFFIFSFLANGLGPLLAQDIGGNRPESALQLTRNGMALALIGGTVALVVIEGLAPQLLGLAGAGERILEPATEYLRIRALAVPALLIITLGNGIFRGHADTVTPLWISLGFNVANAVMDPIFIFGFGWGLAGAAWASVIAQWGGAVAFLGLLMARQMIGWPRLRGSSRLLRVSRDFLIRTGSLVATFFMATRVAASVSEPALAAHQVASQLFFLLALTTDSLAVAGQVMVGSAVGADDRGEARSVSDRLITLGLATGVVLAVAVAGLRGPIGRVFLDDPAALAELDVALLILAVVILVGALVFVWDGLIMGAGDFWFLAWTMVVASSLTIATLLTVQAMEWGLAGVWWAFVLLMVLRSMLMLPWHRRLGSPRPAVV